MDWQFSFAPDVKVQELTAIELYQLISGAVTSGNVNSHRSLDSGERRADQVRDELENKRRLLLDATRHNSVSVLR